uniref:Right handed beta helix domain-containing protein n=1 Tax=Amphimedon queenslandica TaxID=400682 RepID=A0A1X7TEX1_AMPQE
MELCLSLQWLFLLSIALSLGNGEVFYVHPNNSSQCLNDTPCYGINEYADGIANAFMNDTIYYFLPGVHNLNRSINIKWGSNLTFQGKGMMMEGPHTTVMESPVVIQCVSYVTATFSNCDNLSLSYLTIENCGYDVAGSENGYPGLVINASSANLSYMSLQESQWIALWFIDVSDITVYHSSFYRNGYSIDVLYNYDSPSQSLLKINECNFTESFFELFLTLYQNVYVDIRLTAIHLYDSSYEGIYLFSTSSLFDIQIDRLVSIGCAGTVFYLRQNSTSVIHSPSISITDSVISQSSSRALLLFWYGSAVGTFHLNSTRLDNNLGTIGSALYIATDELFDKKKLLVLLYNSTFDSNGVIPNVAIKQSLAVTLGLLNSRNINISNCTFSNNRGSALGLVNAMVTFFGDNYFNNNTGRKGGAINFIITSYIYLSPDAYLSFINNHAEVRGGAINIDQPAVYFTHDTSVTLCFFQFLGAKNKTYFYFARNTVTTGLAGTAIYGGAVDSCLLADGGLYLEPYLFLNVSKFVNQSNNSVVSSDPLNVCFCNDDNTTNCSMSTIDFSAFPGQIINFTMALIGQLDNLTTGTIDIINNDSVFSHTIATANCELINYKFEPQDVTQTCAVQTNVTLSVTVQNSISFNKTVNISKNQLAVTF